MRKGIFRRIFLLYAAVLLLAIIFIEIYITSAVRESYINDLGKNLFVQINLISEGISFDKPGLDSLCRQLKEKTVARITIIASDGKVIGDSDTDSSLMDNHINRTEIEQSLLYGTGISIRYSNTLKYDFLYAAKKIMKGEDAGGFIRLAVPLREIDNSINTLRMKVILVVSVILLATGIFSLWQTENLRRLIRQIMDFSGSIASGKLDRRLFLKMGGEFDEIAGNLNEMSGELKNTLAQNEEERNRLNVILRSIPEALLIIDSEGIIQISSAASRRFFGEAPVRGKQYIEVVRNHEFFDLMDNVQQSLEPGVAEFRLDYPEERYFAVRVSPLSYKEGELSGFVAIFHDITQMKKLEEVRKDFVANVSHEIKTPITAIKGFADTLLEGAIYDKENAVKFIETIKSNSERIDSLVDDLMTISKIELGVIRVEKSLIDIEDVIENVLTVFRERASEKNLYLKLSVKPELGKITADRERLMQIFTNLVDNAIKFTEGGGIILGVDEEDGKPFLFVEDTGIGIPRKHLPRLGERFYRVDPARSRKMGGTGLGLAIVKHLVKAHGWDMRIESTQGKGTKVKIFLIH